MDIQTIRYIVVWKGLLTGDIGIEEIPPFTHKKDAQDVADALNKKYKGSVEHSVIPIDENDKVING